jgi:hypothetical protein
MFGKSSWQPVTVNRTHGQKAEVIEFKDGEYRVRTVELTHE